MTAEHLSLGAEGEDRAAAYLRRRGYRIVARNVRQGPPELAVDARKTARLLRGAAAWLQGRPGRACEVRFDVVACEYDRRGHWHLRHLEAAFDAGP
ncbi:MAG: YraN family protein [Deltaproteobacteria bacterium]|nr:YraN family protein [Deltaproteobacteria bacterium]